MRWREESVKLSLIHDTLNCMYSVWENNTEARSVISKDSSSPRVTEQIQIYGAA